MVVPLVTLPPSWALRQKPIFRVLDMLDILRDSLFGNVLNHITGGKVLPYRDQLPDYQIPSRYILSAAKPNNSSSPVTRVASPTGLGKDPAKLPDPESEKIADITNTTTEPIDPYIVDWDGEDDQDNPRLAFPPPYLLDCGFLTHFL